MKRIYITAIPLDSNFAITPYAAEPVNYTQTTTQPTCYPITPILADTAHDGDEIKVIAVRQVNSPHSENLEVFRRELDSLGRPYTLIDLTTPENQQRDGLLALFEALTDAMESDACYYADATFGTKTYPLVLSSALHYAEKILDDTEVCGIYYRELTRESGQVRNARQYDISTLFTLDGIVDMAADAELALHESLQSVLQYTPELAASVRQREDDTDKYEDTLGTYLVHLATQPMNDQDSVESSKLLHLIGDFERIADHAVNIVESSEELKEKDVHFTDSAKRELQTMLNAVGEIVDLTSRAFLQDDLSLARQVEPLEQVIDKLKDELRTNHIARLQRGECSLAAGFVLSDLLTNLERVADHCSNIAGCLLDMKNERIDLHKYLGDVKSGSNEFLMQYNTFEEKYKLA